MPKGTFTPAVCKQFKKQPCGKKARGGRSFDTDDLSERYNHSLGLYPKMM